MTTDLASLAIDIDSSLATKAAKDLEALSSASGKAERATDALTQAGAGAATASGKFGKAASAAGQQVALSAFQMQQLSYQLNDFAVQVASGGNPLTALIQQGSQLSGTFGGVGGAIRAVSSLLTVGTVAFGAAAAAIGATAYAALRGKQDFDDFTHALQLSGNAAGVTASSFQGLSSDVAKATGSLVSSSREAVQALVATGQVGPRSLQAVASAVTLVAKLTDRSAADVAADFAKMSTGVARWAEAENRQYHFVTASQVAYLRSLEAQGNREEAARVAAQALTDALQSRQQQLGTIEQLLKSGRDAWDRWWESAKGIGRPASLSEQIAEIDRAVEASKKMQGVPYTGAMAGGPTPLSAGRLAALQEMRRALAQEDQREMERASDRARAELDVQQKIEQQQALFVDATLAVERARFSSQQAIADAGRERERLATQRNYDQMEISGAAYVARMISLDRASIAAKESAVNEDIALERKRTTGSPEEVLQQQARILSLETQRAAVMKERAQLEDKIRRGGYAPNPRAVDEAPQSGFRASELAQSSATTEALRQRQEQASAAAHSLIETNRAMSVQLIQDQRARGVAQIALDEEEMRRRLDLGAMSTEQRRATEEDLAQWRVLRERQLTEELKPEYQRQLELFADQQRYMKAASDEFHQSFIDAGRDAWGQFLRTGKLSADQLGRVVQDTFSKITYDRGIAPLVDKAASAIFGLFGSSQDPSMASSLANQTAATTAQTAAFGTLTSATTTTTSALANLMQAAQSAAVALSSTGAPGAGSGFGGGFLSFLGGLGGAASPFVADTPALASELPIYAASGTNYVQRDNQVVIAHRGEAIVPRQFNPLAGGVPAPAMGGAGAARTVHVTYSPTFNIDSRSDRAEFYQVAAEVTAEGHRQLLEHLRVQGVTV